MYLPQVGHAWQTKERPFLKSSLVNRGVYCGDLQKPGWSNQRQLHLWQATPAWATTHRSFITGAPQTVAGSSLAGESSLPSNCLLCLEPWKSGVSSTFFGLKSLPPLFRGECFNLEDTATHSVVKDLRTNNNTQSWTVITKYGIKATILYYIITWSPVMMSMYF